jgi:transcriptional regulator with XRE-family HTH domain
VELAPSRPAARAQHTLTIIICALVPLAVKMKCVYCARMITDAQSRMGRAAVRWSVRDLARHAEISAATVNRFEMGHAEPNRATLAAIQRALESAGIEFLIDNGVRLKRPIPAAGSSGSSGGSGDGAKTDAPANPPHLAKASSTRSAVPEQLLTKEAQLRALRESRA